MPVKTQKPLPQSQPPIAPTEVLLPSAPQQYLAQPQQHQPQQQYQPPQQYQPQFSQHSPMQPVVVMTGNQHPPEKRLGAGGWFARSFMATSGVMFGYFGMTMLFVLALFGIFVVLPIILCCGGCLVVGTQTAAVVELVEKESREKVSKLSVDELKSNGYTVVGTGPLESRISVMPGISRTTVGNCMKDEKTYSFECAFNHDDVSQKWTLVFLKVDNEFLIDKRPSE